MNVFTYLEENRKLKLVKYNKKYQKLLNISLLNYKLLSKKYITHEGNDMWKIYDVYTNSLIFEGNYINGKGKEFDDDRLKYEGKYLNGRRNGKGKEYNDDENLIFEGFYLNGLKHGKCKEYSKDGKIMIKGEYLNGRYWNIKTYDKNGNINGEIKRGKGIGFDYHMPDNIIFEGEYVNGLKNGKGKEYDDENNLLFEGEYLNNLRHGKGKEYYYYGEIHFEGEYLYGRRWNVKEYDDNKNIINEIKNGKGNIKEFNNNYELFYEGEYLYGLVNGKGKEYHENGKLLFEGEYLNEKKLEKEKDMIIREI